MGIDTDLAIDRLNDELVCSICRDIVEDPVVIRRCEHHFCGNCIRPWIQANSTCAKDGAPTEEAGLRQPCRFYRNTLADVRLRCPVFGCNTETTYEWFERHKINCRPNPEAFMECAFCHEQHMKNEEDTHKQSCLPFLRDKIAKNELGKNELKREREADKKKYEELERIAKKPRNTRYIMTWDAKFPTAQNHTALFHTLGTYYYTISEKSLLDHGYMTAFLCLEKATNIRKFGIHFFLTTAQKGHVKFNCSLTSDEKVLWQNERPKQLELKCDTAGGAAFFSDDLPSDLPSNVRVVVEVIEWEPTTE